MRPWGSCRFAGAGGGEGWRGEGGRARAGGRGGGMGECWREGGAGHRCLAAARAPARVSCHSQGPSRASVPSPGGGGHSAVGSGGCFLRLRSEHGAAPSVPARCPGAPTRASVLDGGGAKGLCASWACGGGVLPSSSALRTGAVTVCRSAALAVGSPEPFSGCRSGRAVQQGPSLPTAGPRSGLPQIAVVHTGERKQWY